MPLMPLMISRSLRKTIARLLIGVLGGYADFRAGAVFAVAFFAVTFFAVAFRTAVAAARVG